MSDDEQGVSNHLLDAWYVGSIFLLSGSVIGSLWIEVIRDQFLDKTHHIIFTDRGGMCSQIDFSSSSFALLLVLDYTPQN